MNNNNHLSALGRLACRLTLVCGLLISFSCWAKPNIVILVGDDVGFSDLGAYGSEISTPHLDQLAANGLRFSNFHTTASCSPTRSMLMTGVDNHLNGLGNMKIVMPFEHYDKPGYEGVLNDRVATIAELLREQDYHTYHLGKWHLGIDPEKLPFRRGFERTIALGDTGADNFEQRSYLPTYDKAHWYADGEEHQLPDDFYSSRYFVDKAIEFIDSNHGDGRPFLTYIGFQAVHIPLQAPREFVEKYEQRYADGWEPIRQQRLQKAVALGLVPGSLSAADLIDMKTTRDWQALDAEEQAYYARRMAVYAGMLDAMDHHVGRLIAHLKAIGEYDNTIFVFLSDNGPEPSDPLQVFPISHWVKRNYSTALDDLGSKGSYAAIGPSWANAAASPLTDYKFYAGEGGVRVPLIIAGPGLPRRGQVEPSLAHIKDLLPTLLALTGTPDHNGSFKGKEVEKITGSSLLPVLQGRASFTHAPDKAIGYELAGNAALYKGAYKLMRNLPPLGDGEWHLFNINTDPSESRDLRQVEPERYAEMLADYSDYEQRHNVLPMPEGYDYIKQAKLYSVRVIVARNVPNLLLGLGVLILVVYLWRRKKKLA